MKKAFTLAETLITLGIIGIVAALTIPSLIQKYNEKVWVTSYLRVYSILENAYRQALNEHGPIETWDGMVMYNENGWLRPGGYNDKFFIYNAFRPYLKISSEFLDNNVPWGKSANCMPYTSYYLNGNKVGMSVELAHYYPTVSLISGECITFGGAHSAHASFFWIDTNGKKGPNTLGKDQFVFNLALRRLGPYGWSDIAEACNIHDTVDTGLSCGSWIVKYHNMDYLHLPFDEVQKRWKGMRYWQ